VREVGHSAEFIRGAQAHSWVTKLKEPHYRGSLRGSSGSLAKFAAIRRASSRVSSLAAHGGQETRSQYAGPR
jgi:hypothetical protein